MRDTAGVRTLGQEKERIRRMNAGANRRVGEVARRSFYRARRGALKALVPERTWPEEVFVDGVPIAVRGAPYSFGAKRLLVSGNYELPERRLVALALRSGDRVVEMGSSLGVLTAVMARRVGDSGRVVAVEADAALAEYSRGWLSVGGIVDVVAGFGFPVNTLPSRLRVTGFDNSGGSLGGTVAFTLLEGDEAVDRSDCWDIQRISSTFRLDPQVLVVDIEGSERVLLEAAPEWPGSLRDVILELHPGAFVSGIADRDAIIEVIAKQGFELQDRVADTWWFRHAKRI